MPCVGSQKSENKWLKKVLSSIISIHSKHKNTPVVTPPMPVTQDWGDDKNLFQVSSRWSIHLTMLSFQASQKVSRLSSPSVDSIKSVSEENVPAAAIVVFLNSSLISRTTTHLCIFLPKFHCELAFIEFFWGSTKKYLWENCDYSFDTLKTNMPIAMTAVPLATIRRWELRSRRWMDAYRSRLRTRDAQKCLA